MRWFIANRSGRHCDGLAGSATGGQVRTTSRGSGFAQSLAALPRNSHLESKGIITSSIVLPCSLTTDYCVAFESYFHFAGRQAAAGVFGNGS
jgi:hypothetical protein